MNNKLCVGSLTNIRDMFIVGSERCEGEALEYHQNFISALNYAIELINSTEKPQSEWIPVSERLPEQCNTSYLVTVDYDGDTFSCQRFFFNDEIGWNDYSVIAWQPLPKPYEKAVKNNETY